MDRNTAEQKLAELRNTIVVDRENVNQFSYELYRKRGTTLISDLIEGSIQIHTREGFFVLGADWRGRIAIDTEGYPYPIAEEEFQQIYEAV